MLQGSSRWWYLYRKVRTNNRNYLSDLGPLNHHGPVPHICVTHYGDTIMGAIASQITSLATVYYTAYSDAYQRKHHSSALLAFVRGIHRWIPRTNGQLRRKCFHLMTSSWFSMLIIPAPHIYVVYKWLPSAPGSHCWPASLIAPATHICDPSWTPIVTYIVWEMCYSQNISYCPQLPSQINCSWCKNDKLYVICVNSTIFVINYNASLWGKRGSFIVTFCVVFCFFL